MTRRDEQQSAPFAQAFIYNFLTILGDQQDMRVLLLLIFLMACDLPGPHFQGIPATRVVVDGSTFDVRIRGRLGEAIRTNAEYAPRFGPIALRAKVAIENVSGCEVQEMRGDQAQALGVLDCGPGQPNLPADHAGQSLYCKAIDTYVLPQTGELVADYDCDWG
jgi:hypothetical protein